MVCYSFWCAFIEFDTNAFVRPILLIRDGKGFDLMNKYYGVLTTQCVFESIFIWNAFSKNRITAHYQLATLLRLHTFKQTWSDVGYFAECKLRSTITSWMFKELKKLQCSAMIQLVTLSPECITPFCHYSFLIYYDSSIIRAQQNCIVCHWKFVLVCGSIMISYADKDNTNRARYAIKQLLTNRELFILHSWRQRHFSDTPIIANVRYTLMLFVIELHWHLNEYNLLNTILYKMLKNCAKLIIKSRIVLSQ